LTEDQDSTNIEKYNQVIIPQPWHTRAFSFGAFLLLSCLCILILDLLANTIIWNISFVLLEIEYYTSEYYSIAFRLLCIILFIMVLWIGYLGKPIYTHRLGRFFQFLLKVGIIIFIGFYINLGVAILLVIAIFLWNPSFLATWEEDMYMLYRMVRNLVIVFILTMLAMEVTLTEEMIGFDFAVPLLVRSLTYYAMAIDMGWLTFAALIVFIPAYILLPRVIVSIWNFRPNIESFWKEFKGEPIGIVGLLIVAIIVLIAVLAPFIAPYAWDEAPFPLTLDDMLQPPSTEHLLGTNHNGQDIYSRLIYGAQISLLVGFTSSIVSVILGTLLGLFSGYYGGLLDTILMRITDVFLCLPTLPLMLIALLLFGQGLQNVILVIAIISWMGTARMVRSEALSLRERPLTEAAHALGASDMYILFKHILPNTLPLIMANVILGVVGAILSEAGIAFLGFLEIHGQPSWGILLHWASKNAALLNNMWWWIIPPGLFIMLTTLGFTFISHAADKVVNPRLRGRRG
jgi:peptide/nickel transport system permease protein